MEVESIVEGSNEYYLCQFLICLGPECSESRACFKAIECWKHSPLLCPPHLLLQPRWNLIYQSEVGMKELMEPNLQGLRDVESVSNAVEKKKEMEAWLNYLYLKMFNQLYMSSSFIKYFHVFFFLQNSSFSFKDTDRKFPSNVDVSMFAGLWSLKIKSRGTGI